MKDRIDVAAEHQRLDQEFKERRAALGQRLRDEQERERKAENERMSKLREAERLQQLKATHRLAWQMAHPLTQPAEYDKESVWRPWVEAQEAEARQRAHAQLVARLKL